MRILLWVIFSLTAALFALGVKAGSPAMVVADLVGGVTMFIIVAKCMEVARRRRGVFVLQCIDHSLRLNAPLPEMLRAAAQNESGRTQDVLREIANYIEVGMTIGDALEQAWAGLTPRTLRLIRAAEQGGRLQPQIARIVEEERQAARVESIDSILMLIYPVILVVSLAGLFGAVTIFIMPKYARIFEDFDAQLPELTLWFVREATPYGSVLLAAAGLLGIGLLVKAATDASDRSSFSLRLPWRDWLAWHLPVWRAGERPRAFRDAFALMADVLDSGEPLPGAVGRAVSASSNGSLRRRLRQWQAGIESGMSVDAAAGGSEPAEDRCRHDFDRRGGR